MNKNFHRETTEWLEQIQNTVDYAKQRSSDVNTFFKVMKELHKQENEQQERITRLNNQIQDKIRRLERDKDYRENYKRLKEQFIDDKRITPKNFTITDKQKFINIYWEQ